MEVLGFMRTILVTGAAMIKPSLEPRAAYPPPCHPSRDRGGVAPGTFRKIAADPQEPIRKSQESPARATGKISHQSTHHVSLDEVLTPMSKKSEQPAEPIVLTVSLIESGRFIRAGEPTPYLRVEDVPEHLRQYLVTGDEGPFFTPAERDFYNNPQPEPELIYQPLSGERGMKRQAMRAASISQEQIYAEQEVERANALSPEAEEALQDSHDRHAALMKAQLAHDRDAIDRIYEIAAQESEPQKLYLRRGSVHVSTEKVSRFKPGEHVFARRPSGEYESVGIVDSEGELPPEEIMP